jgi:2,3-bisphosphoglycerate-dependent phosphoglycerate mutase
MPNLLMLRHGQSTYNLENRFTGWLDVPLSNNGIEEAKSAAIKLKVYRIDIAYTSKLLRAIDTLRIVLNTNDLKNIPVIQSEALNERNYGELQGLNKSDTAKKYGDDQVLLWRRSYSTAPPGGESLKATEARIIPFFRSTICKDIKHGLNVLVVAHGNSLRAIIKELEVMNDDEIANLNISTGEIYLYQFDADLKIIFNKIL